MLPKWTLVLVAAIATALRDHEFTLITTRKLLLLSDVLIHLID